MESKIKCSAWREMECVEDFFFVNFLSRMGWENGIIFNVWWSVGESGVMMKVKVKVNVKNDESESEGECEK